MPICCPTGQDPARGAASRDDAGMRSSLVSRSSEGAQADEAGSSGPSCTPEQALPESVDLCGLVERASALLAGGRYGLSHDGGHAPAASRTKNPSEPSGVSVPTGNAGSVRPSAAHRSFSTCTVSCDGRAGGNAGTPAGPRGPRAPRTPCVPVAPCRPRCPAGAFRVSTIASAVIATRSESAIPAQSQAAWRGVTVSVAGRPGAAGASWPSARRLVGARRGHARGPLRARGNRAGLCSAPRSCGSRRALP